MTAYAGDLETVESGKSGHFTTPNPELQYMLALHDQYTSEQPYSSTTAVAAQTATVAPDSQPIRFGTGADGKNYLLPAEEIVGFNILLNRFNYYFIDKQVYGTTLQSVGDNLHGKWIVDSDPFAVNQFMHPYQGSVYFGLARSSGLDFWESMGYTFGGSLLWEIAGETGAPSINDLVTTGFGGSLLGEPLFRMANE
ncbi:hypothetical protein SFSGTM_15430 [Sulfuriferula nivalis]|uniref:DUF3943 domain-containing protein n=2 Tax=Sulfuriferula nivalis TaxID=2675298 RepID=A0A809RGZ5_9PROT|nr:hypothetical protein SFSGTM_15430 [Sulfuriferula nivalis]